MPWNDQNGGNRGNGGGGGPWGNQPGGGGGRRGNGRGPQQPPDLDELLRKGAERLKGGVPGGGMGVALVLLVVAAVYLLTGIYRVETDERGVVLQFGKHLTTTDPGLRYHLPWPIQSVFVVKTESQQNIEIGATERESRMLTGDSNILDLQFNVQWIVADPREFLFNVATPEIVIKTTAESVVREVVGRSTFSNISERGRQEAEEQVKVEMQRILNSYGAGVLIAQVKFGKVDPHPLVVDAYLDVTTARADRTKMENQAEAYRNKIVPEAEGQAARVVAEAEAYREQVIREAEGEAQRFTSVYNEYRLAPDVTRRRLYLETMEDVFEGTPKMILENDGSGVVPYLPLKELSKPNRN